MADITITGDAKLEKINQALRATGKEAKAVGGASKRSGMAVLELARGIEDFSVAGMRGALNNIPGIVQGLTGSAGIAGAASLAAVGMMVFGKKALDLASGLKVSRAELEKTSAISNQLAANFAKLTEGRQMARLKEQIEQASAAAREFVDIFLGFNPTPTKDFDLQGRLLDQERGFEDRYAAIRREIDAMGGKTPSPVDTVSLERAAEDLQRIQKLVGDLGTRQEVLKQFGAELDVAGGGVAKLEGDIAKLESKIALSDAKAVGQKVATDFYKGLEESKWTGFLDWTDDISQGIGKGLGILDKGIPSPRSLSAHYAEDRTAMESLMSQEQARLATMKEQLAVIQAQGTDRAAQLKMIESEAQANREALESAREKLLFSERDVKFQGRLKELEEELVAEEKQKNIAAAISKIDGMKIDPGNLLSSKGRIGGSGAEYQSSIATINYQKEANKHLREIVRNTKHGARATFT